MDYNPEKPSTKMSGISLFPVYAITLVTGTFALIVIGKPPPLPLCFKQVPVSLLGVGGIFVRVIIRHRHMILEIVVNAEWYKIYHTKFLILGRVTAEYKICKVSVDLVQQ